jgi:hypothetical protein
MSRRARCCAQPGAPEAQAAFEKALALSPGLAIADTSSAPGRGRRRLPLRGHYQRALASDAGMVEAHAALSRVERQPPARSGR